MHKAGLHWADVCAAFELVDELSELMESVQMARPHRRVFSDALAQIDGRTGAAAPGGTAAATLGPHQQQAAVLAQQPSGIRTVGRCLCALGLAAVVLTGVLLAKRCMDTPGSLCRPGPVCRHGNSTDQQQ